MGIYILTKFLEICFTHIRRSDSWTKIHKLRKCCLFPLVDMFQKYGGHFSGKKKRLRQRTHTFKASRYMGAIYFHKLPEYCLFPLVACSKSMGVKFLKEKKNACGNVPTNSRLPDIWGPFSNPPDPPKAWKHNIP